MMDTVESFYPLAPMQQGILFQTLYAPEQRMYHRQCVCTVEGPLNESAFRRAWEYVVSRHEALRTSFLWEGLKQPTQVVHRSAELPWLELDWATAVDSECEQRLTRFLDEDRLEGFDLTAVPLLRAALIKIGADKRKFVLSFHHIVVDGWSLAQVFSEVLHAYRAFENGGQPEASAVVPFRNYISWLQNSDRSAAEAFWRGYLEGFRSPTPLGVDRSRRPDEAPAYEELRINVEDVQSKLLRDAARRCRVTLNTLVQGAWALVISRYSGERDVVFGSTVAGRPAELPNVESMVGLFINTIAVRSRIEPSQTAIEWLQSSQKRQAEARAFEYSRLTDVQSWSAVPAPQPLFESLLVFENTPGAQVFDSTQGKLRLSTLLPYERTGYPLTACVYVEGAVSVRYVYDRTRLTREAVARFSGHFLQVLNEIAANPSIELRNVSLLTTEEREQIHKWNETEVTFESTPVPHIIQRQAEQTPHGVAVSWKGIHYTYEDVNARANRLANFLRSQGVERGSLVGVCMERSLDLVVSLLGVVKAGAAYVPLDPGYPADRLAFMVSDCAAPLVITAGSAAERLPASAANLVNLDSAWPAINAFPATAPDVEITPDDLVYVIYTSGSTGQPKGAMNLHRGLTNRLLWMQREYRFGHEDCVAQKTPFSFDVSVWEFFWPLMTGARIAVAEPGIHQDPVALGAFIERESVTTIHFVPSMLQAFLSNLETSRCRSLRRVICSGEALPGALQRRFFELLPAVELHNLYGPTEASIDVTYWQCRPEDGDASVPIGRPIANTQIHIVDSDMKAQPVGVAGELLIGGVGVGKGYWRRPELTAERFVSAAGLGPALYRTGDLARRREDGAIEYLGRLDHQVKIRGLRVELGEIESVLRSHNSVRDCVVHPLSYADGDQRLVAWVVLSGELDEAALRAHLGATLPEYMVPFAFVPMSALPLNPSGKVDRKALPAPERESALTANNAAPRTAIESALADIFAEVLRLDHVSIDDDFFELGGHSLLATQLVARIRRLLEVEVPLRTIFECRTVTKLALAFAELSRTAPKLDLQRQDVVSEAPLSLTQQRIWFVEQLHRGTAAYNIGVAVRLEGTTDVTALQGAYRDLCERHDALRTTFPVRHGKPVQVIAATVDNKIAEVDLADLPQYARGVEATRLARESAAEPFDLESGPVVRACLIRISEVENLLVLVAHHMVSDGWSQGIMLRDLMAFYERRLGAEARLPELPVRYVDFASAQRSWAESEGMAAQVAYWREKLSGAPPVLALPSDFPRPAVQSFKGGIRERTLGSELSRAVREVSRRESVTTYMTLMAAFVALLQRYSCQDDLAVGIPISGRNQDEIENVVGLFANTLVFRTKLDGDPTVRELLARVRSTAIEAYGNQDVPFEKLVEELSPERTLSHSPLFQVAFVMEDALQPATAGMLKWSSSFIDTGIAKMDLVLGVVQGPEGLRCLVQYDAELFRPETADRLLRHYETLLRGMIGDLGRRVLDVPLLTSEESDRAIRRWNETSVQVRRQECLHELITEHAQEHPDKVAVVCNEVTCTYGEFERLTNQFARYLHGKGVGPESLVGIALERSLDMVVAVFGVLKAGAAYLPLDPAYPAERLRFMLGDSGAKLLVTDSTSANALSTADVDSIVMDIDRALIARESGEALGTIAGPHNLAYVIYTSGSTGRPKGVMIEHRSLTNLAETQIHALGLKADDRVLQFASLSFDASIFEMTMAFRSGATLCLAKGEAVVSTSALAELLRKERVSVVILPPSVLANMPSVPLPDLRILTVGGEACTAALVSQWAPGRRFFNLYGPTEATVWATYAECSVGMLRPPIGRPVANAQVYVLDAHMRPCPVGAPGEIYVGGAGVARGYLNRPELTSERFVRDPFRNEDGARLYRTGDLARYRADGNIDFVGRTDHQLKVRGFRIEAGEIEAALREDSEILDAAVIAREDTAGDLRLVAYVVGEENVQLKIDQVRDRLKARLPHYMVPGAFVQMSAIPLTPNLKVDRKSLPAPETIRTNPGGPQFEPTGEIERRLAEIWRQVIGVEQVGRTDNFFDLGGHSLLMTQVQSRIQEDIRKNISVLDLFRYPTIESLAAFLSGALEQPTKYVSAPKRDAEPIAIVGMSGRFPGASTISQFWRNLRDGRESVSQFTKEELLESGVDRALVDDPKFVRAAAILENPEWFDAAFFGFTPLEAAMTDPQHRIFLECAYEALETAGCAPAKYPGKVGVFAGAGMSSYFMDNILSNPDVIQRAGMFQAFLGAGTDFVPSRVSYKLNLTGPAINVQSACSTSLLAVHLAMQSLLAGECDVALAGGVTVHFPQKNGYLYEEDGIFSADGHCRAFDVRAKGTVSGSGAAVVVLKRLSRAMEDGDTISAVILSSAINNDGTDKVGYTAPSVSGQAAVVAAAMEKAGISPDSLGYVETHGTGTLLGDPIEIAALTQAYRQKTSAKGYCAIGSLKSNVGHLDAASGAAGLIKAALALQNEQIPASLNFEHPNPALDLPNSPFYVNAALREWPRTESPRRAGVSSFGIGGTNVHLILQEAPVGQPKHASREWQLLTISAKSDESLGKASQQLISDLKSDGQVNLSDAAFTLHVGRNDYSHRQSVICRSVEEAEKALDSGDALLVKNGVHNGLETPVIFMFPGGGAQYPDMGRALYESEPVYRDAVDKCADLVCDQLDGTDIREWIYPSGEMRERAAEVLRGTLIGLPALFATEYALAQLWISWGVQPKAMIGHSLGEYVAACIAGVCSLEDALTLVTARASLMAKLPAGGMLAISMPEEKLLPILPKDLAIAAINSREACVVSGREESISSFEMKLRASGTEYRRVNIDVAAHSPVVEQILPQFCEIVRRTALHPPKVPYISDVTGTWITPEEATDVDYWGRHLRHTVRFAGGLSELLKSETAAVLEVGPGHSLTTLARHHAGKREGVTVQPSMRHVHDTQVDDVGFALAAVGQLWASGAHIDWQGFHTRDVCRRIPLSPYPFERERHWIERGGKHPMTAQQQSPSANLDDWFWTPVWKQSPSVDTSGSEAADQATSWLILSDEYGFGTAAGRQLHHAGHNVTYVRMRDRFEARDVSNFLLNPMDPSGYERLVRQLKAEGRVPKRIAHFWSVGNWGSRQRSGETREYWLQHGLHSILHLWRAFADAGVAEGLKLDIVSSNIHAICGERYVYPEKATVLGPCRVLPQEFPGTRCRNIDLDLSSSNTLRDRRVLNSLCAELASDHSDQVVAFRGHERWVQEIERVPLRASKPRHLRAAGVYLITGGLGAIGLEIAEHLSQSVRAELVLTTRSPFPKESSWDQWLSDRDTDDVTSVRIRRIRSLKQAGSRVLVVTADVSDLAQMRAAVRLAERTFGRIQGVIHAAGLPGGGMMQLRSPSAIAEVLAPKVEGTAVLESLFSSANLDFMVLCSSLSSVTGATGLVDYCAANAFLEAHAHAQRRLGRNVVAINWNAWAGLGMASSRDFPAEFESWWAEFDRNSLTPAQGVDAFTRILKSGLAQVIVSSDHPTSIVKRAQLFQENASPARELAKKQHSRPKLGGAYVPPSNDAERTIAEIWEALLGMERVGASDNFFNLGGHSLLGTRVIARLQAAFQVDLPLRALFEAPTVATLARLIKDKQAAAEDGERTRLLEMLRDLPEDVVEKELAKRSGAERS